jgi:hypothetical protein
MAFEIPNAEADEWIALLRPYQRQTIASFLEQSSLEEAAKKWLSTTGSPNIVPFGGQRDTKPFWERFEAEFKRFVCDDQAYVDEKKALSLEAPANKALLIATMSAALGATIGFAATLLAPAVALLLCFVGKIGKNAFCAGDKVG